MSHDTLAARILAAITREGAPVVFPGATLGTYNEATGKYSGAGAGTDVTGRAVQTKGDPDRFAAANLVPKNPVALLVAAKDLDITPKPGTRFVWGGVTYSAVFVDPHGPDGTPLYYGLVGDA